MSYFNNKNLYKWA